MGLEEKKALLRRVHETKETAPDPAEVAPPSGWGQRGNRTMGATARVLFFLPLPLTAAGLAALGVYYDRAGRALTPDMQYARPIGHVLILGLAAGFFFLVGFLMMSFFKEVATRRVRLWSLFLNLGAVPLVVLGIPGIMMVHGQARSAAYAALPHETIARECQALAEAYQKAGKTLPWDVDPTDGVFAVRARYLNETLKPQAVIIFPHGVVVETDNYLSRGLMEGYYCPTVRLPGTLEEFAERNEFTVVRQAPALLFFRGKMRHEFEWSFGSPSVHLVPPGSTMPGP